MILQVNKKKNSTIGEYDGEFPEFKKSFVDCVKEKRSLIYDSRKIGRKVGKTSSIGEIAREYDLPILTQYKVQKSAYNHDKVFSVDSINIFDLKDMGFTLILIDGVKRENVNRLLEMGFVVIGFEIYEQKKNTKIYEDYIEISSVRKMEDCIVAQCNKTQIYLYNNKEFIEGLDGYNLDNLNFVIDSVYLLDDTGKTIKKLM